VRELWKASGFFFFGGRVAFEAQKRISAAGGDVIAPRSASRIIFESKTEGEVMRGKGPRKRSILNGGFFNELASAHTE
jgi:hypothetical protein